MGFRQLDMSAVSTEMRIIETSPVLSTEIGIAFFTSIAFMATISLGSTSYSVTLFQSSYVFTQLSNNSYNFVAWDTWISYVGTPKLSGMERIRMTESGVSNFDSNFVVV